MNRYTKELLEDLNRKRSMHEARKKDKFGQEHKPLYGHVPRRRALSPSAPHSKTWSH